MFRLLKNRYFRTIFLSLFASATFVASAIFIFDADPMTMLQFFIVSLVGLLVLVLSALLFTGLWILIKAFMQR